MPGARISSAVDVIASLMASPDNDRFFDLISAAMPAACGAAAEVPKNGLKPDVRVVTPSAAAISGLTNVVPPLVANRKLPGVIAVPFALKNIFRGPSELKTSVGFREPPTKG